MDVAIRAIMLPSTSTLMPAARVSFWPSKMRTLVIRVSLRCAVAGKATTTSQTANASRRMVRGSVLIVVSPHSGCLTSYGAPARRAGRRPLDGSAESA